MFKKLNIVLSFVFLLVVSVCTSNVNAASNNVDELFDYKNYLNDDYKKSYANLENQTYISGKFNNGAPLGHRNVIKFGKSRLVCKEIEKISDSYSVGSLNELKVTKTKTYNLLSQTTLNAEVTLGIQDMANAALKFKDIASVGKSNSISQSYSFGVEKLWSQSLEESVTIQEKWNLSEIPSDKKSFSISRVACYVELDIIESYMEDEWWWHWYPQAETRQTNYKSYYYIDDLVTFVYNDNTFGTVSSGIYNLLTIKEYD